MTTNERDAFEKWLLLDSNKAHPKSAWAAAAWEAWQARAVLDQRQGGVMTEEMVDVADDAWTDVYDGVSHNHREAMRYALRSIALPVKVPDGFQWIDGIPVHPWDTEWFIAELDNGDRVVLKALPKEYTYDFKTADETYLAKRRISRWMQFPDSEFVAAPSHNGKREG